MSATDGNILHHRALTGTMWVAVDRSLSILLKFVVNLILAWLLTPADFACIGMVTIFIAVSNTLLDSGFGTALIREPSPSQSDYSTVFWWNLLLALILVIVLGIFAPLIAGWLSVAGLSFVIRGLSLSVIADAFSLVPATRLRRQLDFRLLAIINMSSFFIAGGVAVIVAFVSGGVLALVLLQVVSSVSRAILLFIFSHWLPSLSFATASFRRLFGFGGYMFAASLLQEICTNIQGLVIGRINPLQVGYFNQAQKLDQITSYSLPQILVQVLFPVYSSLASDSERLIRTLASNVRLIAFTVIPLLSVLVLISEPLIHFLYGNKWLPAVVYFRIFCLGGFFVCLQNINFYAVASVGNSRQLFWWSIYKWSFLLIMILIGSIKGPLEIAWSMVISSLNIWLVNAWLVSRYVGFPFPSQLKAFLTPFLPSVLLLGSLLWFHFSYPAISVWILGGLFLGLYVMIAFIFKFRAIDDLSVVRSLILARL